jgi:hypothetical protein
MTDRNEWLYEVAACLWEAALGMLESPGDDPVAGALYADREGNGTSQVRMTIIGFTEECEAAWQYVANEYSRCFDWDFVPDWLRERLAKHYEVEL